MVMASPTKSACLCLRFEGTSFHTTPSLACQDIELFGTWSLPAAHFRQCAHVHEHVQHTLNQCSCVRQNGGHALPASADSPPACQMFSLLYAHSPRHGQRAQRTVPRSPRRKLQVGGGYCSYPQALAMHIAHSRDSTRPTATRRAPARSSKAEQSASLAAGRRGTLQQVLLHASFNQRRRYGGERLPSSELSVVARHVQCPSF